MENIIAISYSQHLCNGDGDVVDGKTFLVD